MFIKKLLLGIVLCSSMPSHAAFYIISDETDLENSIKNIEKEDITLSEAIYTFIATNKTKLDSVSLKTELLEAEHKLTKQNYKQKHDTTSYTLKGLTIGYCICSVLTLAYKLSFIHKQAMYANKEYYSIAKTLLLFSTGLSILEYFKDRTSQQLEGKILFIKMSRELLECYDDKAQ